MQCTDFPKNPEGYAFKCYRTLDAQKLEVLNFDTIDWLYQRLQQIGKKFESRVTFKIPRGFTAFAVHNDNLVVHASGERCINEIQDVLDEWERTMGVPMLGRHYSRTELAVDRKQNSFSSFIAQYYAEQLLRGKYSIQAILLGAIEASSKQGFTSKNPRNIFSSFHIG